MEAEPQGEHIMPDDPIRYHIILLPSDNYWAWVQAAREYALKFRASVTPKPHNAVNFHSPEQVITVVVAPNAYPEQGDIAAWLSQQAPQVRLDVLRVTTPAQLRQILAERVSRNMRLGSESVEPARGLPIRLLWPTDYSVQMQPFGVNAELYRRWGLPGHEGVDIRAPLNSHIYACADGVVYRVHDGSGGHPYGIHVRVRHADGYKTIYAHLNQVLVHTGQAVKAGDVIGLAGRTGNSVGSHLHLTLKKTGASAAGATPYPNDIIDPTPYLIPRERASMAQATVAAWPYDHVLVGLHGRVGGAMQEADWAVIKTARIEALLLRSVAASVEVDRARAITPDLFVMVRLEANVGSRAVQPAQFVSWISDDLRRFYERGVRYFEVHTEPNLTPQGYGTSWRDGHEFGRWFLEVVGLLRPKYPEARFGWPGLSPGPTTSGMRFDHEAFLESAAGAVQFADWIGCHCYWENDAEMFSREAGLAYKLYLDEWPDKLVLITEFSNPSPSISPHVKGTQYLQYFSHLRNEKGVGAAFAFAVSAVKGHQSEVWRGENGRATPIVAAIGSRSS